MIAELLNTSGPRLSMIGEMPVPFWIRTLCAWPTSLLLKSMTNAVFAGAASTDLSKVGVGIAVSWSVSVPGAGVGSGVWASVGVAFGVSTVTAFIVVKWLLGYIQSHRFTAFALYRILFGGMLLVLTATGTIR